MPSFDVVSKTDNHEVANAVDQTNREISTRFDFRGTDARVELAKTSITLIAPTDFQLKQVDEILKNKLAKRNVDVRSLEYKDPDIKLNEARQLVEVKQGIGTEQAKKIVKLIKEANLKVQAAIQGEQVRVTGKKKDDLQGAIAMLREAKLEIPLQFENFRD
ncbi:MAG: YajQ family cyclic di-GMP-binding protein [Gammaproteobacteria bacterium]